MLQIKKQFINYNKSIRNQSVKYIVIHSTGNVNDTSQNNYNYFNGGNRGASADFFVDDNDIVQIIDSDNYYSWAVGDGHGTYGITNANSVSIEMCGTDNGNISEKTIHNTIDLIKYLMNYYGININHVVRHYDASRKSCPDQFKYNNWSKWWDFKNKLSNSTKQGWNENNKGWWYCTDISNGYYYKDEWKLIDGYYYRFDENGYCKTGWIKEKGRWYYLCETRINDYPKCSMLKGWFKYKDRYCYLIPFEDKENGFYEGQCLVDCKYEIDRTNYFFDKDGYIN